MTCLFDNDSNAFADAAEHKYTKYLQLKEHFISRGFKCDIYPFVIGALGSWYKKNELLCTQLGMSRRYKSLFRKLCCTDAIRGRRTYTGFIWVWMMRLPFLCLQLQTLNRPRKGFLATLGGFYGLSHTCFNFLGHIFVHCPVFLFIPTLFMFNCH